MGCIALPFTITILAWYLTSERVRIRRSNGVYYIVKGYFMMREYWDFKRGMWINTLTYCCFETWIVCENRLQLMRSRKWE